MAGHNSDYELKSVNVTEQAKPPLPSAHDVSSEEDTAHVQTRTRRLFSLNKLFAFHLNYMGTWYGVGGNMYFAMYNGGPSAWFFGYLIIFFFACFQVASFAELSSIQPIAGAQYYWTYHFAPPTPLLEALVQINYSDYEQTGWRTMLITLAVLSAMTFVNLYCFRVVPFVELITGILSLILFLAFVVIYLVMGPRNSVDIFTTSGTLSGWEDFYASSHVGALSSFFLFIGFEGVINMGEESKTAQVVVPKSLLWSVVTGGLMGFIFSIVLMFVIPSPEVLIAAANPQIATMLHVTGSIKATTAMGSFYLFLQWSSAMCTISSASRLTWAWARDGGLPQYFGHVDGKYRIPLRAVSLNSVIIALLSLLNLGSGAFVALGAISSLATTALYINAIILAVVLYARFTSGFKLGEWNLGKWGAPINVIALVYTIYAVIWFPWPQTVPVDGSTLNYSGPVTGLVLVAAVTLWFMKSRHHWEGPSRAVAKIVLENAKK
ncbi:Uu.00g109650.m01.CDS01 [Anthostomella pinea]|uniref:Uu.00g109650.m01.CDS01 n=1 Tax=Anthostomella pinea TaxID=933095 RepID=A0AAI8YGB8_9PEZI|nr:Uu.00g109650.m01.CDS01 [Anthostomella pinea]